MKFDPQNIARILEADIQEYPQEGPVEHICFDSRQVIFPKESIFFALYGKRHDGHDFAKAAWKQGIRNFVLAYTSVNLDLPESNIFRVPDPLLALQKLATFHRNSFDIPIIGITGSNGKTIVKEWLFQLLAKDMHIVRSPKSYNSQIGVPLSVLQIEPVHQLGIFEAGISRVGEMHKLAPIIQCDIGIFTYIGDAHRQGFESRKEKIREKLKLFKNARYLVYQHEDEQLHQLIREELPHINTFTWSARTDADLSQIDWEPNPYGCLLKGKYQGIPFSTQIPFSDAASRTNALHCLASMLLLEFPIESILPRLRNLRAVEMRLEMKAGINQCTLINDAYNADLASLNIALQFLEQQSSAQNRCLILSDLLETGHQKESLYPKVAGLIREKRIKRFIGIGRDIAHLEEYLPEEIKASFYTDTKHYLQEFNPSDYKNETILLKGARPFAFELIADRLSLQAHNTVLEINLNALRNNLEVFHNQLKANTKLLVMVKAAAYGSGAFEVARLLEFQRVDYLGVAYADEGVALRKAGIKLPILVLNPEIGSFPAMRRYQIEPEIYSIRMLESWIMAGLEHSTPGIHLKLETGMNRLGIQETDMPQLLRILQNNPDLEVLSVFSHLAASEEKDADAFSHKQASRLESMAKRIRDVLPNNPDRHLLNSSGIARFPQYQYEMVRLGIGVYGQESSQELQPQLETVFSLKARLSQIKDIKSGETIGYNRMGEAENDMRMGIVSIGYADGLLRLAGNGRYSLHIRGSEAPTIGNICMDMCMVDLSEIPDAREGDEVLIFGPDKPVKKLAEALETIPYEVFTNISGRVRRVYIQE
ncbi:MAG: bifunctional UDP-N-acetylmuramoyl-tripeptide:D-alanyl-D-alanine ligase/alanine racemase [Bacteroidetes bacterium]|nr:bifunctional UDP-N-acetylmuramoyl-tripeptide:D-alanyl-D-alanine ligase/alanine racemase [Bacteroidota bacterium]